MNENALKAIGFNFGDAALSDLTSYAMTFGKNILIALAVFFIGRFFVKHIVKLAKAVMQKNKIEASLFSFAESFISITLNFVLALIIISILGIETSSFVALFASAGVAIGMALSGTLQNFAGGVMVLIFHPYKVGDYIEAQGYAGTVKEIQIFNTILVTPDNQTIIVPNGSLSTGSMKNYSTEPYRRVDIHVTVAYGTKPDDVRKILNNIINADSRIEKEGVHAPAIPMTAMAASSIDFQMRLWTTSANYWSVYFDTTEEVYKQLSAAGISIPYQQIDVHMKQ